MRQEGITFRRVLGRFRPTPAVVVAIAALVVALGGVAYATIPDTNGVIHGCYASNAGLLGLLGEKPGEVRAIDTDKGQTCQSGEMPLDLASQAEVAALKTQVSTLQGQVSTLQGQVSTLQSDDSAQKTLLAGVTRTNSGNTLQFSGMNLQLVNGVGGTETTNGLGNLIIGYNEGPRIQTGSHNLVLGEGATFTSYGGLIGGDNNTLAAPDSVVFGLTNEAGGQFGPSSVLGGKNNFGHRRGVIDPGRLWQHGQRRGQRRLRRLDHGRRWSVQHGHRTRILDPGRRPQHRRPRRLLVLDPWRRDGHGQQQLPNVPGDRTELLAPNQRPG